MSADRRQKKRPYFAHETAICDGEKPENNFCDPNIGEGTKIWHHAHIMDGAKIGKNCVIGQNVFIGSEVVIGDGCKLQNNVNVYDGVTLEDFVFCGPSMTFTNLSSPIPRAAISRRSLFQRTLVKRYASIGAGAVIVCGTTLGVGCFVGAGAVVTRDVPDFALVVGVPARLVGFVCLCGERLLFDRDGVARCLATYRLGGQERHCGRVYRRLADGVVRMIEGQMDL